MQKTISFIKRVTSPWRRYQFYLWLKYAIRNKSLTFFSVVNPNIPLGGMVSDRKSDINQLIASKYIPTTVVYDHQPNKIEATLEHHQLHFPMIVKPNVGVGGHGVSKIDTLEELKDFLSQTTIQDLILQNFIKYRREFSVLYYSFPKSNLQTVFSIVEKKYPFVTGDEQSTILELIENCSNHRIRKDYILKKFKNRLNEIPAKDEEIILDYIGNYVSGAEFVPHDIDIPDTFVGILHSFLTLKGEIHFARLDLKADSVEELIAGKFEIIEVNGAKSEPLEIYSDSVEKSRKKEILHFHWAQMEKIAREQNELGYEKEKFSAVYKSVKIIIQSLSEQ